MQQTLQSTTPRGGRLEDLPLEQAGSRSAGYGRTAVSSRTKFSSCSLVQHSKVPLQYFS